MYFDLLGPLVTRDGLGRFSPTPGAIGLMPAAARIGVLCNLPAGRSSRDALAILEEAGIVDCFDRDLVIVASDLSCPLPDRRAFMVAAALAELAPDRCGFISDDAASCAAAAACGMEIISPPGAAEPAVGGPSLLGDIEAPGAALLSGEVDEDIGPTFVLVGRVVTMAGAGEVLEEAQLVISQGRIAALVRAGDELPIEYSRAPRLDTRGTIYPGLIDLHNHFVYDVLPLWAVPKQYSNRSDWPRAPGYSGGVTLPVRALAERPSTARAIVRFVEAKALMGGTTTGQGMRTRVYGGPRLFRGAMRNVEETKDPRLPEAGTMVPTLYVAPDRVRAFRAALERRHAYFYHLAEGTDARARRTFTDLDDYDLLQPSLVGIHCLGLERQDLERLAQIGAKCVWSPFSNLLLYGETLTLASITASGVRFCIGCDWTPTGSKNLLQELKVARWAVQSQGSELTTEDLVRAVTSDAAAVVGWENQVGTIRPGALGDILVLKGDQGDPFDHLVAGTEADVSLVIVHGVARYGDAELMSRLHFAPELPLEKLSLGAARKAFNLHTSGSDLNGLSFEAAGETLRDAMSDLVAFRASTAEEEATLTSMGLDVPSFTLDLDNEYEPLPGELPAENEPMLAADWDQMEATVPLDEPVVGGDEYWARVAAQRNLPDELKRTMKDCYGR